MDRLEAGLLAIFSVMFIVVSLTGLLFGYGESDVWILVLALVASTFWLIVAAYYLRYPKYETLSWL